MNARDALSATAHDPASALTAFADRAWDERIVPALTDYIGALRSRLAPALATSA